MIFFNPTAIERAQRCLNNARKNLIDTQNDCVLAKVALQDAGRESEAVAIEMICASLTQNQRDIIRWSELIGRSREAPNG